MSFDLECSKFSKYQVNQSIPRPFLIDKLKLIMESQREQIRHRFRKITLYEANFVMKNLLKELKLSEITIEKRIPDHFSRSPNDDDLLMDLSKSLKKSGISKKELDLFNQQICTSCDHNRLGYCKRAIIIHS